MTDELVLQIKRNIPACGRKLRPYIITQGDLAENQLISIAMINIGTIIRKTFATFRMCCSVDDVFNVKSWAFAVLWWCVSLRPKHFEHVISHFQKRLDYVGVQKRYKLISAALRHVSYNAFLLLCPLPRRLEPVVATPYTFFFSSSSQHTPPPSSEAAVSSKLMTTSFSITNNKLVRHGVTTPPSVLELRCDETDALDEAHLLAKARVCVEQIMSHLTSLSEKRQQADAFLN